ncbi:hypothetical protein NL676_006347 [Syzygium grande]|nr:hypothetical protein NL676_006347 [Syzygium grande]
MLLFLLLHLGRWDMITAYIQEDDDLWLRQLARLCILVGLTYVIFLYGLVRVYTVDVSSSGQAFDKKLAEILFKAFFDKEKAEIMFKNYELFKIFKLLFLGFIGRFGDLDDSKRIFMDPNMARVDLLYTKAPLLTCAWVVSLSVPC